MFCCAIAIAAPMAYAHGDEHANADRISVPAHALESAAVATGTAGGADAASGNLEFLTTLGISASGAGDTLADAPNPGEDGLWGPVQNFSGPAPAPSVVPVFAALLPNGKILAWDYYDSSLVPPGETPGPGEEPNTRAITFDPATGTANPVNVDDFNLFCAGFTQLADGNVFVAGGQLNVGGDPIDETHIFDWQTETWSRGPDMTRKRWYPSVAALSNGESLIVGGDPGPPAPGDTDYSHGQLGNDMPEVRENDGSLRDLPGLDTDSNRFYPFLAPAPDGRVLYAGWDYNMQMLDTAGSGSQSTDVNRDGVTRAYGSFAQYKPGELLVNGGMYGTPGTSSTGTKIAFGNQNLPVPTPALAMNHQRRHHFLTVLADGSVLATGGLGSGAENSLVDINGNAANEATKAAELWDPNTGQWEELASATKTRQYHSVAMLLPDGRVMSGGGGICGVCQTAGYYEPNYEIFSPPYLFTPAGAAAPRPSITSAPATAAYNTEFAVATPNAFDIEKVSLVKLGAPTHAVDQGQRYVPLEFTDAPGALTVKAPANAYDAPPGYYMLFLIDDSGVPSVSTMVKVGGSGDLFSAEGAPVQVFATTDNSGKRQSMGSGAYRSSRGNLAYVGDNAISSLTIAAGFQAVLCPNADGSGSCATVGPGTHSLSGSALNDAASYVRVEPKPADPPPPPPPPPPPGPPKITMGSTVKLRSNRLELKLRCPQRCTLTADLFRGRNFPARSSLEVFKTTRGASPGTRKIVIKLKRADLRTLRAELRRRTISLAVEVVDSSKRVVVDTARIKRQ